MFHISSLIFIPIVFLISDKINKSFYLFLLIGSFIISFLNYNFLTIITKIDLNQINILYNSYFNSTKLGINDDYLNIFSLIQISRVIIVFFLLNYIEVIFRFNRYSILLLKIYILSIIFYNIFSDLPIVAVRLSQLLGIVEIILIPFLMYIFKRSSRRISFIFQIAISSLFFLVLIFYRKIFFFK
jgi:hypothetical protein